MESIKVSIIVPCYNQALYIEEALNSILNQSFEFWECIIVNDGSTDESEELAMKYVNMDKRFKYFFQANSGVVKARNHGISKACGEYLLHLDGDDKIHSTYIEKCVNCLESNLSFRIVYSNAEYFGEMSGMVELKPYSFSSLLIRNMIYCSALHYREDALKVGGYDENMAKGLEDWEYWISILKAGGNAFRIEDTLFCYRKRKGTRSSSYSDDHEGELRKYIYFKHSDVYITFFGDPINVIREKEYCVDKLNSIRRSILFKALRKMGLFSS